MAGRTIIVTVHDGQGMASPSCGTGGLRDPASCPHSMDEVFRAVRLILAHGGTAAHKVLRYDPTYGYPTEGDYLNPKLVDDFWGFKVSKFTVLSG
jgi:hypothetical protein